jgi:polyisoprenoid-binding protein YceI
MQAGKWVLATVGVLAAGVLLAAELRVGPASKSTVVATFKQEGVAVDCPFTQFTGSINYDAKNPAAGGAVIEVDMASIDIGDPAYSAEVRKKSWFDTASFPKGVFRSTSIKPLTPGKFMASGTLSIKGKTFPANVTVTVTGSAAIPVFDGGMYISRKAFGIGDPIWNDVLEDTVLVKFHLVGSN